MEQVAIGRWSVSTDADLRRAFDELLEPVYRYASRLAGTDRALAEDLAQDAFVRLVQEARNGDFTEVGVGWMVTVVRNRFIDHLRAARGGERVEVEDLAGAEVQFDESAWLVAKLHPIERLVLVAHHVDGFPVADVARMIGRSEHATESLLARARATARRKITPGGRNE